MQIIPTESTKIPMDCAPLKGVQLKEMFNSMSGEEKLQMLEMLQEWRSQNVTAKEATLVVRPAKPSRNLSKVKANFEVLVHTEEVDYPIVFNGRPSLTLYLLILLSPDGLTRNQISENNYDRYKLLYALLYNKTDAMECQMQSERNYVEHIIDQGMSQARKAVSRSLSTFGDSSPFNIDGAGKGAVMSIPLKHKLGGRVQLPLIFRMA